MSTYTIEKSENNGEYVLFDNELNLAIAAGSQKEMMVLKATLCFEAPEIAA